MNHPENKYDRKCNNIGQKLDRNIRQKLRLLNLTVILEKMWENQSQLILQLINIAPDFLQKSQERDLFYYWKLISFLTTIMSLARSCVSYDFKRNEFSTRLFSFHLIGKGFCSLHPQELLLFLIHSTAIAGKVLVVVLLMILVNHDFSKEIESGSCSLSTAIHTITKNDSESTCLFGTKVTWLLFLYLLSHYFCLVVLATSFITIIFCRVKVFVDNKLSAFFGGVYVSTI